MFAELGEYLPRHGRRLKWEDLHIGDVILYDTSTESTEWYQRTVVDNFTITPEGYDRVLLNYGSKQRTLINRFYIDDGRVKLYAEENNGE